MLVSRIAIAFGLFAVAGGAAYAAVDPSGPATVSSPAARDVPFSLDAQCDLVTVEALATRHPNIRQFVVMRTDSFADTYGHVDVAVQTKAGVWKCQRSDQTARFGRAGTRPLLDRRSGDGTTPAGVFPLGVTTAWDGQEFSIFGNHADPGVQVGYRNVRPEDCWGATKNTARYQHLVNLPGCRGPEDEWLQRYGDVYSHAAVIGANLSPISGDEPGEVPYAAAIFLHHNSYTSSGATKPTSGCVSIAYDDLVATLRGLDPRLSPHFAIGPTQWLRTSA